MSKEKTRKSEIHVQLMRDNFPKRYLTSVVKNYIEVGEEKKCSLAELKLHYSDKKYVAQGISEDAIERFKPQNPVIISAQTGSGKNFFIFDQLVPKLLRESNDEIFIVSNRIALTRQTKLKIAEIIATCTGNRKYAKELQKYYTNEGIDTYVLKMGQINICSYHQLYAKKLLNTNTQFKYIILDEFHFFTSDATFNPETYNILQYIVEQGQTAIRIYMSATPEVAFEVVCLAECKYIEQEIEKVKAICEQKCSSPAKNAIGRYSAYPETFYELIESKIPGIPSGRYSIDEIQQLKESLTNVYTDTCAYQWLTAHFPQYCLPYITIEYFYFKRNYDYLNFKGTYREEEELLEPIKKSESKWIVFVNSNAEGHKLRDKLIAEQIECCYISRDEINAHKQKAQRCSQDDSEAKSDASGIKEYDPHAEYDYIIGNETFRPKVLITTSVLDNGINIKNSDAQKNCNKVLNIAINAFDKTDFVQMLGRIRPFAGTTINLYVKEYSLNEIKKITSSLSETLVTILNNDFQDVEAKQNNFDKNLFYYTNDPNTFSTYNPCAVHQLISQISFLLSIIKHTESEFFIKFSNKELEAIRTRVTLFYLQNKQNSWQKNWSRSILDILESELDRRTRQNYANKDIRVGVLEDRYAITYEDTFEKYLLTERLPQLFLTQIDEKYKKFMRSLDESQLTTLNTLIIREEETQNIRLSVIDKIKIAQEKFQDEYSSNVDLEKMDELASQIRYYKQLGNMDDVDNLVEARLKYVGITTPRPNEENVTSDCSDVRKELDIDEWIRNHAVTEQLIKDVMLDNKQYIDKDNPLIKQYGIPKGEKMDKREEAIISKYFPSKGSFTEVLKDKKESNIIRLDGNTYKIRSVNVTGHNHPTYYLVVIQDSEKNLNVED